MPPKDGEKAYSHRRSRRGGEQAREKRRIAAEAVDLGRVFRGDDGNWCCVIKVATEEGEKEVTFSYDANSGRAASVNPSDYLSDHYFTEARNLAKDTLRELATRAGKT